GFAAEIERIDEERAQIADFGHRTRRELVEQRGPLDHEDAVRARAQALGGKPGAAELAKQPLQEIEIERRRIEVAFQRRDVAFLPMLDDIVEEIERPGDAALEEAEAELGKPTGDAAKNQRAAEELVAGREVAEMVEDIVRGRGAIADAARGGMAHRRHLELDALAPEGIVVVRRVHHDGAGRLRGLEERVALRRLPRSA